MLQPSIENPASRQYQILVRLVIGMFLVVLMLPICLYFDLAVASRINYLAVPGDLRTLLSCAEVFGHSYGVTLILATIWFASPHLRRQVITIAYLLLANCLVVTFLKNSILRTRPRGDQALKFDSVWETFAGYHPAITQFDFSRLG